MQRNARVAVEVTALFIAIAIEIAAGGAGAVESAPPSPEGEWNVRWDRAFANWQPPLFHGHMTLKKTGDTWTGDVKFDESSAHLTLESVTVAPDHVDAVFNQTGGAASGPLELWAVFRGGDRFVGEVRWGKLDWTPIGGRRVPELVPAAVANTTFPPIDPHKAKVDEQALQKLVDTAQAEHSSALVVVKDGHTLVERYVSGYDGSPTVAMSASKSVTSLAIGMLIAEKKLALDTKLGDIFPEWRDQKEKASITIRQLLTHTSGLDQMRAAVDGKASIEEHVAKASVVFPPGTRFQYNNDAVDLLSVIVKKRSGVTLEQYLDEHLMKKLGIVDATWMKDRDGNAFGAGELIIRPVDFAKIGQMLLDGGVWKGERIVSSDWIAMSTKAEQPFLENCGFLWWRDGDVELVLDDATLAFWKDAGVSDATLAKLKPLMNKPMSREDYRKATRDVLDDTEKKKLNELMGTTHLPDSGVRMKGPVKGFSARGWLGQFLVVDPKARIVAVRMRRPTPDDYSEKGERDGFREFPDDVHALTR